MKRKLCIVPSREVRIYVFNGKINEQEKRYYGSNEI
jgi:hypothetical protein